MINAVAKSRITKRKISTVLATPLLALVAAGICAPIASAQSITSDKLVVEPLKNYDVVWDDRGSGADRDVTVLKPKPPGGYYILGYVAVGNHDAIGNAGKRPYTFAVKPTSGNDSVLSPAEGWDWVYDDAGSGADSDLAVYKARCRSGYVALGSIAHPGRTNNPGDPNFRCISRDAVEKASWHEPSVWTDAGSGGDHDAAFWAAGFKGKVPPKTMIMVPNTFTAVPGGKPSESLAYALKFTFNNMPNPTGSLSGQNKAPTLPSLNGPNNPPTQSAKINAGTVEVPFNIIDDPYYDDAIQQWLESPTYKVTRTDYYEFVSELDNTSCNVRGSDAATLEYSETVGFTESSGWAAGAGVAVGYELTLAAAPLGIGAEATVTGEISASYEYNKTSEKSTESSNGWSQSVPKGTYLALYKKVSDFEVTRKNGSKVDGGSATRVDAKPFFVGWQPKGWTEDSACNWNDKILDAGSTLVPHQKYFNADHTYYLELQTDGNLVVKNDNGGFQWGLNEQTPDYFKIKKVVMQADGNLAAYDGDGNWVWSALTVAQPSNTHLYLKPNGALQIINPDGTVAWSTK